MTKKELPKLIPFGIASILVLTHVIQTLLKPGYVNADGNEVTYAVSDSVMFCGFGLLIVLTLILLNKQVWTYIFTILTLLAFTPWISFYNQTFSFGIGIISFEVTALSLLIFHLALNPEVFQSFKASITPKPESEESKQAEFESSVLRFENKFEGKSCAELQRMLSQNELVPEAIEAAKRLLERDKSAATRRKE